MSQTLRPARARRLTGPARPGTVSDGYGNLIVARLRKLAGARSSGILPFSGDNAGAIYLAGGRVAYAESVRAPGAPVRRSQRSPFSELMAALAVAEATADASLELLSGSARYAKFRPSDSAAIGAARSIALEDLLTEITRRRRLLKELSSAITPDTPLRRTSDLQAPAIRVSAAQWALLIRIQDGRSPRELAWKLSRSVFSTTLEAYRLMCLGLVSASAEVPPRQQPGPQESAGHSRMLMSFTRAASDEKGQEMSAESGAGVAGNGR